MKVKFDTVKNTVFGEFLGCAFQDLLRKTLQDTPEKAGELNCDELDISLSLNGIDLNFQRLFTSFETKVNSTRERTPEGGYVTVSRSLLEGLLSEMESLRSECSSVDSSVEACFSDALDAAGTVVSEHAADAAREAGFEHSPGSECTEELYGYAQNAIEQIEQLLEETRQQEAA